MKKKREFDDILNDCLERIVHQGETVEQCLERYPEQSDDLQPLLQTISHAKIASNIEPSPEFKERARHEFRIALHEMGLSRNRWFLGWRPQWVTAIVSVLVLLLASGGAVAMAGNSMPDEPLYSVKRATEAARIALTPSPLGKVEQYMNLADKRVAEIAMMAEEEKPKEVEKAAELLNEHLTAMAGLIVPREKQQEKEVTTFMAPSPAAEEAPQVAMEQEPGEVVEDVLPPSAEKAAPRPDRGAITALTPETQKMTEPSEIDTAEGAAEEEIISDEDVKLEEQARLKALLAHQAVIQREALHRLLQVSAESVKPALRQAIDIVNNSYAEVLKALD